MRARFSSLVLSLTLALATPALAQTQTSPAAALTPAQRRSADADFLTWAQHIQTLMQRANGGMQAMGQAGDAFNNPDPQARAAALHQLAQAAVQARADIAAIRPELDSMQEFSEPGADPVYYQISASLLRDAHTMFDRVDGLLADMVALVQAIDAHDTATVQRLTPHLVQGMVVLVQSQATILRARQATIPNDNPAYYTLSAMAAMYDGMAALISDDKTFDPAPVDAAADKVDHAITEYRAVITIDQVAPHPGISNEQWAAYRAVLDRTVATDQGVATLLHTAAQEARAGTSSPDIRMNHLRELSVFEDQYQAESRDQVNIAAQVTAH